MKATEQCFHVVLFVLLYKVVLTFQSVDETLVCDYSRLTEQYFHLLYGVVLTFKSELNDSYMWYCLLCCTSCTKYLRLLF